jgi:hypothetical protein
MPAPGPEAVPVEATALFASDDFVAERNRIAKELRAAGRTDEAAAVAALRKPPKLVAVINRAARALPLQAQAAAAAAERLAEAQAAGNRRASEQALARLGNAVDQLAARAAEDEEGDRGALAGLIRAALTSAPTRRQLAGGGLTETPEPSGFEALAGLTIAARPASARSRPPTRRTDARRERLERELSEAERELSDAEAELRQAEREEAAAARVREGADRRVESARGKIERLRKRSL